jgi:hypothetical protein
MNCINKYLSVKFDKDHNKIVGTGLNGLPIIRPDAWLHKDAANDHEKTTVEENVDYKETHPQICIVTAENPNYPYRVGDRLFVHYMAYETAAHGDIVTYEAIIIADYVFFKINLDGTWDLADDTYIGEPVINDEWVSPSGILVEMGKKDNLRVNITHVYKGASRRVKVGDIAISIDKYNYEFKYENKKYVKLSSHEIAGIYKEEGLQPVAL